MPAPALLPQTLVIAGFRGSQRVGAPAVPVRRACNAGLTRLRPITIVIVRKTARPKTAQAIVFPRFFGSERSLRRLIGVIHAGQADIKPEMEAAAALRKEERRARLSVRGAVIGAGAGSRNPLAGSGGGGPRNRARRSVFRLPGPRAHISRLFRVSAGARPRGMPFRSQVGTRPPGASWILQWRLLEAFIRPRKPPPDCRPLRTAFRLLRSSLLANPHPDG